jgi:hypothetical protein
MEQVVEWRRAEWDTGYPDEYEAYTASGRASAYESAADALEYLASSLGVDVEDVEECVSATVFYADVECKLPHKAGSHPVSSGLMRKYGCDTCTETWKRTNS